MNTYRKSAKTLYAATLLTMALGTLATAPYAIAAATEIRIVSGQARQNGEVLREIFDDFNAKNPDVKVNLEMDNKSDVDTTQKVLADIASGSAPDAVRVTSAVLRAYVDSGRAQPLDACLAQSPELAAQLNKDLLDSARYDGKLFAMPWYTTLPALFINATAFRAAGLDPSKPPRTWSELEAAAAKLSDKKSGKFGVMMYMPNTYIYQSQLDSAGGQMVDKSGKAAVASPEGVALMAYMRSLVEKGYMPAVSPSAFWTQFATLFRSGDIAMLVFSASTYPSLSTGVKFDVSMAPMPVKDGRSVAATASTNGFVVLTKDPVRLAATCRALKALVTADNVTKTVKATATSPINDVAARTPGQLGDYYKANPALANVNGQSSRAWYSMPGKANSEFLKVFGDIQYEVLTGAVTPEAGAAKLADQMNSLRAAQ